VLGKNLQQQVRNSCTTSEVKIYNMLVYSFFILEVKEIKLCKVHIKRKKNIKLKKYKII
jgi:hypothetical protein